MPTTKGGPWLYRLEPCPLGAGSVRLSLWVLGAVFKESQHGGMEFLLPLVTTDALVISSILQCFSLEIKSQI